VVLVHGVKLLLLQEVQVAQAEEWVMFIALRLFIQLQQEQVLQVRVIQAVHQIIQTQTQVVVEVAEVLVQSAVMLLQAEGFQVNHPQQILTQLLYL
jgi:hypothetical protein